MAAVSHSTSSIEPSQKSSSQIAPSEITPRRLRTVVVDDSETFLKIISSVLDLDDAIDLVGAASHGLDAIDMVLRLQPELILIDVNMPGLDGLATSRMLSSRSPAPAVILMSADDSPNLRAACRRAGAFDFVHKENFHDQFQAVLRRLQETQASC